MYYNEYLTISNYDHRNLTLTSPFTLAGLPLVLSTPHFYQSDEVELAKLEGLNPRKADHETTIDVEPVSG